jgi:hypothetical protein
LEYLELAVIPLGCYEAASKEKSSSPTSNRWKGRQRLFEFPKASSIDHIRILKFSNQGESESSQIRIQSASASLRKKIWSG